MESMHPIRKLENYLGFSSNDLEVKESLTLLKAKAELSFNSSCEWEQLAESIATFPKRDVVSITLSVGEWEHTITSSTIDAAQSFHGEYEEAVGEHSDQNISLALRVDKRVEDGVVSLYFPIGYGKAFCSEDFYERLLELNNMIGSHKALAIQLFDDTPTIATASLKFTSVPADLEPPSSDVEMRESFIEQQQEYCHFGQASMLTISPYDLCPTIVADSGNPIIEALQKACLVLSAIYLFDVTELSKEKLTFKLKGKKTKFHDVIHSSWTPSEEMTLFRIFKWAYTDGNLSDKLYLARNIISMHMPHDAASALLVPEDCYYSIQSGFAIYLKDNVAEYIGLKNSLSEFLQKAFRQSLEVADGMASSMKANFFAILTFFFGVIIAASIKGATLGSFFTKEAVILTGILVAGSFAHLLASSWETRRKQILFSESYARLKARYDDVLDGVDMENITGDDAEFNKCVNYIKHRRIAYFFIWFSFLALIGFSVLMIYSDVW